MTGVFGFFLGAICGSFVMMKLLRQRQASLIAEPQAPELVLERNPRLVGAMKALSEVCSR